MIKEQVSPEDTKSYADLKSVEQHLDPSSAAQTTVPMGGTEECESEEEIVTQSMPPTEVVDTVVTVTTNPDGSLKRTTRKTTRTMVTTTRVKRITTRSPAPVEESTEEVNIPLPTIDNETNVQPKLITLIGAPQDDGDNRVTQATFTFMTPATRTEVMVSEGEQDIDQLDTEVAKHLKTRSNPTSPEKLPGEQKSHTKTTVRKTVTASAATATFVSKGPSKPGILPNVFDPEKSRAQLTAKSPLNDVKEGPIITELNEDEKDASTKGTTTTTTSTGTTTTTTTKRTSRVVNNLANKGLHITRAGFESLKKPFSLFGKEMRRDSNPKSETDQDTNKEHKLFGIEDTEQLALLAMKESERLFSEAGLLIPSLTTSTCNKQVIVHPSQGSPFNQSTNQTGVEHFQSRFANLPLYQGYGFIGQQLAKCNQQGDGTTPTLITTTFRTSDPAAAQSGLTQEEFDKQAAAGAFVNLLDESTERFLRDAVSQWSTMGYPQVDRPSLTASGMPPQELGPVEEKQKALGWTSEDLLDTTNAQLSPIVQHQFPEQKVEDAVTEPKRDSFTDLKPDSAEGPRLSHLGVSRQGAFRVAWSDMPEVLSSDALKTLTRHEIQLQEAMFEVITSEASYYQSLNVLVKHFYNSPEFSYGSTSRGDLAASPAQFVGGTTGGPNSGNNTAQTPSQLSFDNGPDVIQDASPVSPVAPPSGGTRRPLLKPLEKHHLFSNVLLVCLASEKFLKDLETRWVSQMPVLNEVCDLIVKHAGGANFEPYITYLRNQAYQMQTLRKLCQRDSFRSALEALHSDPVSGKNSLSSFLALPMQRLTRLKLLVEVIRRLQDSVIQEANDPTRSHRPHRVPTDRERENVQLALRELSRLLAASETEKELMDQKARLLTLSTSLEFPDNVKSIAISDKRLIKEGEVREGAADNRLTMLQKLSLKKPSCFYLILFNDLLLVTKKKKNDRYLVLDYCDRAELQAEVRFITTLSGTPSGSIGAQKSPTTEEISQKLLGMSPTAKAGSPSMSPGRSGRAARSKTTTDFGRLVPAVPIRPVKVSYEEPVSPQNRIVPSRGIARSGSSVSSYHVRSNMNKSANQSGHSPSTQSEELRAESIHLTLAASHNGTFSELHLLPKDNEELVSWCKAFSISMKPSPPPVTFSSMEPTDAEEPEDSAANSILELNAKQPQLKLSSSDRLPNRPIQKPIHTSEHDRSSSQPKPSSWFRRVRRACSIRNTSKYSSYKGTHECSESLVTNTSPLTNNNHHTTSLDTNSPDTRELDVSKPLRKALYSSDSL